MRDDGLDCVEAVVERQQRIATEGNDDGLIIERAVDLGS
jgi:hypothetical protein